jgi:hypothetical protein
LKGKCLVSALILVAALSLSALAQTVDDAQKQAIAKYPDLTRDGSELHTKFLELYHEVQETDPGLLSNPNWPLILADQAYALLAADAARSGASASPSPEPSPTASATPAPSAPQATPAASVPREGSGNQTGTRAAVPVEDAKEPALPGCLPLFFEALTAIGTLSVAIVAIWKDQIIDRLNPVRGEIRRSNFEGKEEGTPEMTFLTYHVRAVATRRSRPLKGCAIVFRQVNRSSNAGTIHGSIYPVWLQLPWAPVERTEAKPVIVTEQEADLGQYNLQKDRFEILYYKQGAEFDPFVIRGQSAKIFLHLRAENLPGDIASVVTIDMTGPAGTKPMIFME